MRERILRTDRVAPCPAAREHDATPGFGITPRLSTHAGGTGKGDRNPGKQQRRAFANGRIPDHRCGWHSGGVDPVAGSGGRVVAQASKLFAPGGSRLLQICDTRRRCPGVAWRHAFMSVCHACISPVALWSGALTRLYVGVAWLGPEGLPGFGPTHFHPRQTSDTLIISPAGSQSQKMVGARGARYLLHVRRGFLD